MTKESKQNDHDDWAFKIDDNQESDSSVSNTLKKEKNKRPRHKPLTVDHRSRVSRKSRRAVAQELNVHEATKSIYVQNYASFMDRIIAGFIDLVFLFLICFVCKYLEPVFLNHSEKAFSIISSFITFEVETLSKFVWQKMAVISIFLLYTVPSILYKKSVGKSYVNTYIGKEKLIGRYASFSQACLREIVFKPLSLISIFGVLMILVKKDRRALHDRLAGTAILREF